MSNRKIFSFVILLLFSIFLNVAKSQAQDPLLFPKNQFTVETKSVKTSAGEKKITYRAYMHILYVAKPVDKDYQSLNVFVPTEIDGQAVNTQNVPILFAIGVGGYMSVNNAKSTPAGGQSMGMGGPPPNQPGGQGGGPPNGNMPPIPPPSNNNNKVSSASDLALAAGYVVVQPGCRGRDNKAADGIFYGKAPAAIVDLKAAVRYLRHNKGIISGNVNWIFARGVSAGGALTALLGASGNSLLYDSFLQEIGAAEGDDSVLGAAPFCPITDLEHADGAYEWMYGTSPIKSGLVEQDLSKQLIEMNKEYQASLKLQGKNGFGTLTASNYGDYLLKEYMIPSANFFLKNLSEEKRNEYLSKNTWLTWKNNGASFAWNDYVAHVGRMKGLPAFDDFNLKQPEPSLFGNKTVNSRHFTTFSQQHQSPNTDIDEEVKQYGNLMNAMYFIGQNKTQIANHWWIRHGTSDPHTSQSVIINLATSLENLKKDVNTKLYWDAGHGADEDAEDFIAWIGKTSGYTKKEK